MSAPAGLRILVTGAGGFVGHWLMQTLKPRLPAGAAMFTLGRSETGEGAVAVDVTAREPVAEAVQRIVPTCVVHLAAIAAVQDARGDPRRAWAVNLGGPLNLAEAVLRHAPQARFLFVSTSEVYGGTFRLWGRPIDESAPLDPVNTYATTKAAADLAVGQMARDGLRAIRLRPFNHTGPRQTQQFVIPAFAAQIARIEAGLQEPVIRVGNLEAERDFLDVRDVVEAYATAIFASPGAFEPGIIINLASGQPRRIGSVLNSLVALSRVGVRIELDPAQMRPNDTPTAVGDAGRARALLGWEPRLPLETTLIDVLDYYRTHVAE